MLYKYAVDFILEAHFLLDKSLICEDLYWKIREVIEGRLLNEKLLLV